MSRPPSYKATFPAQAAKLCLLGATDKELAEFFEVDERTINRWKKDHPEFCQSLKDGKSGADSLVAKRLFQRAIGYSHKATKITVHAESGFTTETPYIEKYPPDTTAAIFWLKNRRSDLWRDKQEVEHGANDSFTALVAAAFSRD